MRPALLLSTLSTLAAATLVSGLALADKPHDASTPTHSAREPQSVERLRAHGDMVDKSYHSADRVAPAQASSGGSAAQTRQSHMQKADKGASRINCSDSGADCSASHGDGGSKSAVSEAGSSETHRGARWPSFLDKIMGSDRTNFTEAGEDEGMSPRAVKRAWEHAGHGAGASGVTEANMPLGERQKVDRHSEQASGNRYSCNEADECSMSNKAVKKEWAAASVRAGTFVRPETKSVDPAAVRLAEQKGTARGAEAAHGGARAEGSSASHEDPH
jgi:hypothetical protein